MNIETALKLIADYASKLDTRRDVCGCCNVTKYSNVTEARAHEAITAAVNRIRGSVLAVEKQKA